MYHKTRNTCVIYQQAITQAAHFKSNKEETFILETKGDVLYFQSGPYKQTHSLCGYTISHTGKKTEFSTHSKQSL